MGDALAIMGLVLTRLCNVFRTLPYKPLLSIGVFITINLSKISNNITDLRLTSYAFHGSKDYNIQIPILNFGGWLWAYLLLSYYRSLRVCTYYFANIVPNLIFKQNKFAIFQTFFAFFAIIAAPHTTPFRGCC